MKLPLWIASLVFVSSASAASAQCFQPSPNLTTLGEQYYEPSSSSALTNSQGRVLDKFLDDLDTAWDLQLTEMVCFGTERNPRPKTQHYEGEGRIRVSDGLQPLSFRFEKENDRQVSLDRIDLPALDLLAAASINANALDLDTRRWQGNGKGGARFVERRYSLTKSRDSLQITVDYYTNGYLDMSQSFRLTR